MAPRDISDTYDAFFGAKVEAKETRCLLFRKCKLSGNSLFFKKAVCLTRTIHGPGTPVYLHYWISRNQYLVLQLSGNLRDTVFAF